MIYNVFGGTLNLAQSINLCYAEQPQLFVFLILSQAISISSTFQNF